MMTRCMLVLGILFCQLLHASDELFPRPAELEPDVRFWVRVYTEVDTSEGFIHDARDLGVVYETVRFPAGSSAAEQSRLVSQARDRYQQALRQVAAGNRKGLSADAERVLNTWPKDTSSERFRRAVNEVRFQRGQSNRFLEGLVRSGLWRDHIRETLVRHGLPEELMVLPHVESSFNPAAYSHAAAAGMWQFMPATGREFMEVTHIVDERLDPYLSTEAAARLLKRNFETVGTWPLAITGYNHGANGVRRATEALGTKDISRIVRHYSGPAFGFASRNFYATFLAALEVDRNPEKYFGRVRLATPNQYDRVVLPAYLPVSTIAQVSGTDLATLRAHNPALRNPIWTGEKHIPRGFAVRVPKGTWQLSSQQLLAAIPVQQRFAAQNPDRFHRIAPGETLSVIAQRHGTSVRELMALNGLRDQHRIRAGHQLQLPGAVQADSAGTQLAARDTGSADAMGTYRVRRGDSLWAIASRHGISVAALRAANNLGEKSHIVAGQELRLAGSDARVEHYIVRAGDSLWSIANRHGTTVDALRRANSLSSQQPIRPGQRIALAGARGVQVASADEDHCAPATC